MYAVSGSYRVYISFFLFLCAAFLFAPSVANASDYWSPLEKRFIPANEVPKAVQEMLGHDVKRPAGTTITTSPAAPTVSKNPLGGLSQTTQNTIRNMGQPSTFSSTISNGANAAKNALKTCVRSPACAGRALGPAAIGYEGINAWKDVYDLLQDPETNEITRPADDDEPVQEFEAPDYPSPDREYPSDYGNWPLSYKTNCPYPNMSVMGGSSTIVVMSCWTDSVNLNVRTCRSDMFSGLSLVGLSGTTCQYAVDEPWEYEPPRVPLSPDELDDLIDDGYEPASSDAPIVLLSGGSPESITLSTPSPVQLPSTTTTNTSSAGTTTTVTNQTINYNVVNNSTPSPSINSATTTNKTTYDSTGNVTDTSTSTTTETGVQSDVPPRVPSPTPAPIDFELPSFCSWAKTVCDWISWTQEPIDEEPDLSGLISEFVPLEDTYDLGIGSGSCPSPIQINITFIGKTVEISYEPFCEFLEMIRPFVLAAAYLLAAYLYLGVLKRG